MPPVFGGVELSLLGTTPRARRDADGNPTDLYEDGTLIGFDAPYT